MPLVSESRIGSFEILELIGSGGMGEVYAARDPQLGRKVAIKVIAGEVASERAALDRFAREARAASSLNHPNIVTIHEVDLEADPPFIVMEWVDGRDVRELIRGGPLSTRKSLDIASQVADGLAAAHDAGIVHRDLKPENLMVRRDGLVKILDFGLAKQTAPAVSEDQPTVQMARQPTEPGLVVGTVGYMSPEQASGDPVDYRSDQFSFGAILYEILTGRRPFIRGTAIDTLSAILHDDPEPLRSVNAKLPAPLAWMVERCLAKDRAERYASTRDLARELRTLRDRLGETTDGFAAPLGRRIWSSPAPMATAIAGLLLAAGFTFLLWREASNRGMRVPPAAPAASSAIPETKYLAVLPFKDLSGDTAGQLVIDGLTETLSSRLSKISGIQVISPSALLSVSERDPKKIGSSLGANLILQGAVQRLGEQIRVSFSLVNTQRSVTIAGDTINGSSNDLFTLQDAVADSVARALRLSSPQGRSASFAQPLQDRYLQAIGYLRRFDEEASVDAALQILEPMKEATKGSPLVAAALGRAYLYKYWLTRDTSWADKAVEACDEAAAIDPGLSEVHVTLGQIANETGRPADAVDQFNRALAEQPSSVEAWMGLGNAYRALGKPAEAEQKLKQAVLLLPGYWGTYSSLGVFYLRTGRSREAAQMFQQVLQLTPDNVRAWNNLGVARQRSADYDGAIAAFNRSLSLRPTADAASNLGTCYYFLGRYADAAKAYERATALTPEFFLVWANLGDAYRWSPGMQTRAENAYDRAIDLADKALQVNGKDASTRSLLAVCLAKRGRIAEAKAQMQLATAMVSNDVGVLYKAALVSELAGDRKEALDWLSRASREGYDLNEVERDPEFRSLKADPGFQQIPGNSLQR